MDSKKMAAGFTLVELMIVVAIVALLASVAYPGYQNQVKKTRRADAQGALMRDANFMERFFTMNNCYKGVGADGLCGTADDDAAPALEMTQSPADHPFYNLSFLSNDGNTFTLRAVPIAGSGQDGDGRLELTHTGERHWDKNNDGTISGTNETKW